MVPEHSMNWEIVLFENKLRMLNSLVKDDTDKTRYIRRKWNIISKQTLNFLNDVNRSEYFPSLISSYDHSLIHETSPSHLCYLNTHKCSPERARSKGLQYLTKQVFHALPHDENKTGCREINIYCTTSTEGDLFSFHSHLFIKLCSAEPISV